MIIEIIFILFLIGIDQLVKYLTVINLKGNPPIIIFDKIFQLTYVENRGAAFGMLQDKRVLFIILTFIFLLFGFYFLFKLPKTKRFLPLKYTVILLIAGAVGNFIDRFRFGYVVDTFYFNLIDFPVFNVADSYVVVSSIILAWLLLFYYKDEEFTFLKKVKSNERNNNEIH